MLYGDQIQFYKQICLGKVYDKLITIKKVFEYFKLLN